MLFDSMFDAPMAIVGPDGEFLAYYPDSKVIAEAAKAHRTLVFAPRGFYCIRYPLPGKARNRLERLEKYIDHIQEGPPVLAPTVPPTGTPVPG
jgi:hypothetical protein